MLWAIFFMLLYGAIIPATFAGIISLRLKVLDFETQLRTLDKLHFRKKNFMIPHEEYKLEVRYRMDQIYMIYKSKSMKFALFLSDPFFCLLSKHV